MFGELTTSCFSINLETNFRQRVALWGNDYYCKCTLSTIVSYSLQHHLTVIYLGRSLGPRTGEGTPLHPVKHSRDGEQIENANKYSSALCLRGPRIPTDINFNGLYTVVAGRAFNVARELIMAILKRVLALASVFGAG